MIVASRQRQNYCFHHRETLILLDADRTDGQLDGRITGRTDIPTRTAAPHLILNTVSRAIVMNHEE
jgi:hypothetical protein